MTSRPHVVHREVIELSARSRRTAEAAQDVVAQVADGPLESLLDAALSERFPPSTHVAIDRLELDVGTLPLDGLAERLLEAVHESLHDRLEELAHSPINAQDPEALSARPRLPAVLYFLEHGVLPWWGDSMETDELKEQLTTIMESPTQGVRAWLVDAARRPLVARRLALQLGESLTLTVTRAMWAELAAQTPKPNPTDVAELLERLAASPGPTKDESTPSGSRHTWARLWRHIANSAAAGCDPRAPEQTTLPTRTESSSPMRARSEPPTTDGTTARTGAHVEADSAGLTAPRSDQPVHTVEAATEHAPAHARATKSRADEADSLAPSAAGSGQTVADPEQPARPNRLSAQEVAEEPTSGVRVVPFPREPVEHGEPGRRAEHLRETERTHEPHTRARSTSGIPQAAHRTASFFETGSLDMRTELTVENAGLVLLWPYLPRFFTHLRYLEESDWRSPEARDRAIHILQYCARGGSDTDRLPESALVLNKVLCGTPLSEPVPLHIAPTQHERDEADALLRAAVANWASLKGTSIDGLRQAFLLREGQLCRCDAGWQLRVQRETHDILLDKLPWGIAMVRLPWMQDLLEVEW